MTTAILLVLLQLATIPGRPYWRLMIKQAETTTHTHVEVVGVVTRVDQEADGDWHFRISDGRGSLICEAIPAIPLPRPVVKTRIIVRGILRYDKAHRWYEIHPVEAWALVPERARHP